MVPTHFTFGSHVLGLGTDDAFPLQIVMQHTVFDCPGSLCCYRKKAVPDGSVLKVEYGECWSHLGCCDNCCFLSAAPSRSLLLQCLWGLFSEHPGSAVERKANQWIRVWNGLLKMFFFTCYIFNSVFSALYRGVQIRYLFCFSASVFLTVRGKEKKNKPEHETTDGPVYLEYDVLVGLSFILVHISRSSLL